MNKKAWNRRLQTKKKKGSIERSDFVDRVGSSEKIISLKIVSPGLDFFL
jgi:hypothetical protein